jgi:pimeloyl-ACP methyl ester carboxylesterase
MNRFLTTLLFIFIPLLAFAEGDPWKHHFVKMSDGANLHYVTMGQGTPIILLHGAGGSGEGNWMRNGIGPALAKTNLVIALDQRGHAYTDAGELGKMTQDVLELMNHLGIEKAHIGGFSMGGAVTAGLLATNPEKFITASFGGSGIRETEEWTDKMPTDPEGTDAQGAQARADYQAASANRDQTMAEMNKVFDPMRKQAKQAKEVKPADRELDLAAVDFPILVIVGEFDRPLTRTHRLYREARDFRRVILPGKDHLGSVMAGSIPQKYIDTMVEFITQNNP